MTQRSHRNVYQQNGPSSTVRIVERESLSAQTQTCGPHAGDVPVDLLPRQPVHQRQGDARVLGVLNDGESDAVGGDWRKSVERVPSQRLPLLVCRCPASQQVGESCVVRGTTNTAHRRREQF